MSNHHRKDAMACPGLSLVWSGLVWSGLVWSGRAAVPPRLDELPGGGAAI